MHFKLFHEILLGHQLELIQQTEGQFKNGLTDTHPAVSQFFSFD